MARVMPKYPVYIPSWGRATKCVTAKFLDKDGVPFKVVVEEPQFEAYAKVIGAERLLILPHVGQGLYQARNWIREHAIASGAERHWQLDDNIRLIRRYFGTQRVPAAAGAALRTCEEFSDRYENVAVSGLNYNMFVSGRELRRNPYVANVHVYSCTLVNHAAPFRWRLLYNDDTDLCLQALVAGWCTLLINVFVAEKVATMKFKGGNTDVLYKIDDGRYKMARQLVQTWPDFVRMDRRWGRPQHVVNWAAFKHPLRLKAGQAVAAALTPKRGGLLDHLYQAPSGDEMGTKLITMDAETAAGHEELVSLQQLWEKYEKGDI